MNVLLKSATILAPTTPSLHLKKRDFLIKNGRIEKISAKIPAQKGIREVQLPNLHLSLGWFDSGVCFGEPGFEERETIAHGLTVAAKSGFTDIVLNPNTEPLPDSSPGVIFLKDRGQQKACRLHPMGTLTKQAKGAELAELYDMAKAGAVAFYDHKKSLGDANLLKLALQYCQNFGGLVCSFPQDNHIKGQGMVNEGVIATKLGLKGIPHLAEELQVARDLQLLEYTGGKLHLPTISTENAVKMIGDAKKRGLDVSCSVAIHNLFVSDGVLELFDSNTKVNPPLRTTKDQKALRKGLASGTIDFVTSDHIPIAIEGKRLEFDNATYGTIGLESAFGILNAHLSLDETIGLLTKGRERFGLETPKIAEGELACLTLFDPSVDGTFDSASILSTSKNSLFIGQPTKGKVYGVVNNNQLYI
ncbi:dihydroorotase [Flagellimonas sp. DF-77]|uniref:dihydroorotase n=1 Tax=Flagellimonas algarum TaxID=3230298 RepID=UPI003394CCB6